MKIIFPGGEASKEDIELLLRFAIEGRKRVKDQVMRIDPTYATVNFEYSNKTDGHSNVVCTQEETQYPQHYYKYAQERSGAIQPDASNLPDTGTEKVATQDTLDEVQLILKGENNKLEFKSTLRWNLHANKPDPRLEHGTLKTIVAFLNTDGGTILVGVGDDGDILGIEADQFANEDKYMLHFANLVNDKIGKQFTDYIRWELKSIKDKKILRINCFRSPSPVFLKVSGQEEFYIRTGPSTVQLTPSEVLDYSRKHF